VRDLQDTRAQLEMLKRFTTISGEMRDVIETEWPEAAAKLLSPKDAAVKPKRPPAVGLLFPGASAGTGDVGDVPAGKSTVELRMVATSPPNASRRVPLNSL
jgi:hypothetical protein